jgi:hypothetical protein
VAPTLYIDMNSKHVGELNKLKILQCLASGDVDGKSTMSITTETGLHRDTVHTLSKQLIAAGLVMKGHGRWGKYRLTQKTLGDISLVGWIFGKNAFKEIWRKGSEILSDCKYCNNIDLNDAPKMSDEEFERRLLFSFTVLIGAYVMFVFLKSFEPSTIEAIANIKKSFRTSLQKAGSSNISGRHKDELVRQWVNDAIQPYMMLTEFRKLKLIRRNLKRFEDVAASSIDMSWGFNVMSEENYKQLMSQFADIFKGLHGVLEKEIKKAPSTRDRYKKHHFESSAAAVTTKGKEGNVDSTFATNNTMTNNNSSDL